MLAHFINTVSTHEYPSRVHHPHNIKSSQRSLLPLLSQHAAQIIWGSAVDMLPSLFILAHKGVHAGLCQGYIGHPHQISLLHFALLILIHQLQNLQAVADLLWNDCNENDQVLKNHLVSTLSEKTNFWLRWKQFVPSHYHTSTCAWDPCFWKLHLLPSWHWCDSCEMTSAIFGCCTLSKALFYQ